MKNRCGALASLFLILHFFLVVQLGWAMESEPYTVLIVPGQNGLGGDLIPYIGLFPKKTKYVHVATPSSYPFIDFGQSRCQKEFKKALAEHKGNTIIHASSQGTATVLNALAQLDTQELAQCKGIILEAVMGSGNSAIYHTAHHIMNIPQFPGSYYLLPYLAKILYPFYSPAGQQPIFSIEKIPNNIPLVIIYSTKDPEFCLNDAQVLYYKLRKQGNNKVLFMKIDVDHDDVNAGNTHILRIQNPTSNLVDLSLYDRDHKQLKKDYDLLVTKENRIRMISKILPWMLLFGGMAFAYKYILPLPIKEMLTFTNISDLGITVRTNFYSALVCGMKEQNGVHNL